MEGNSILISRNIVRNCEFHEAEAYNTVLDMLRGKNRPTAFLSFNCLMTTGAIREIQKLRLKIPNDISLAGYDEIPGQDVFEPKITRVLQPIEKLGQIAAKVLIDKIENPDRIKRYRTFLKPKLVIGSSCEKLV
jgi:LacI family transcriptional regulator